MSQYPTLIDTITMEPHEDDYDYSFYKNFKREAPDGNICIVDVEVFCHWDEGSLKVRYHGRVGLLTQVCDGLAILPDTVFLFSEEELNALSSCYQVVEYEKDSLEQAADVKFHNEGWDRDR